MLPQITGPMFHHDLTHTGYSASTAPATSANLLWNYTTKNPIGASPAIVDGYVYIPSDDGTVYKLNAADGSKYGPIHLSVDQQQ